MAKKIKGLNNPIRDFDGVEFKDGEKAILIKSVLENALASANSPDPIRSMAVALSIHNAKDSVIIDDQDLNELKESVKNSRLYTNASKAPALQILEEAEDVKVEEPTK